ncbi:MAG: DEAD/DEAH box helicase family protein, partial [Rhodoferax sp.]
MATAKRSGHARLKSALVLRDALAVELGLALPAAMAQLRTTEDNIGSAPALADGHYLAALASVCAGDVAYLGELDSLVRQAAFRVRFAPRYAQYLALLLFAHWVQAQSDDTEALLQRLNAYLAAHKPKAADVAAELKPFEAADLQLAAFWMATAAGKTHVLHVCLALLDKRRTWQRLLLITPSESLTRQHAEKLRALSDWDVFAYPADGDASALGRLAADTVIVLDINKLAIDKKGDGLTLPTSLFGDGCNLVLVDEGHKGQKSEAGVWKAVQADLAGINAPIAAQRGLLIEFSATFGQVVEGEHALGRYAKSIVFDYAYDRFHQDRYGKDFWHVRVQSGVEASAATQQDTLTAALLAYWHQVTCFRSASARQAATELGLRVAAPLWVLLGLSVIGSSKNEGDKAQTSDVVDVLRYLTGILAQPANLAASLRQLARTTTVGTDLLPPEVRSIVTAQAADGSANPDELSALQVLAQRVLADCFGWQAGDKPVLRLLRTASGELGLGLLRGDSARYWGVVNVGDAVGLKKALESNGLAVQDDALTGSLFAALDAPGSGLNVLIGSRRFAEGWDNFRASSLTLLRLGQGEGSLIIQMFGRVVRFAGVNGNGKRLERPPPELAPLQTAYVFGLKSGYLDVFLQSLSDNGVLQAQHIDCPIQRTVVPAVLQAVRAIAPTAHEFQAVVLGGDWLAGINEVTLSLGASVATSRLKDGMVTAQQGKLGQDI